MEVIKKYVLVFLFFFLFVGNAYSQSGWYQQNSGTNKFIHSCFFLNDNTGFVTSDDGFIIKTTNGGSNWYSVYNNIIYDMYSVYFINNATGWAVGVYDSEVTNTNIVFKTTNGGQSWTKSIVDTCFTFGEDIYFLNPLTGYLTGCNLKKTTNGGINWFIVFNNISSGVFFINNFTGWTGGFGNGISKTTNEGLNWVRQITILPHQYNTDIYFLNEQNGFFIQGYFGYYGYLYKTTNSGINWNEYNLPYEVSSISFPSVNTGYMLAENYPYRYVAKTTNAGLNWVIHNINTSKFLVKIFFSSINTGWAVGDSGLILKTTTGGVTIGIQPINNEIPNQFSLYQNYPNPFNPSTVIKFQVASSSSVKIIVYDALGREVATLVNEQLQAGTYEIDWDGSGFASGVYYYILTAGDFSATKKMVLLK